MNLDYEFAYEWYIEHGKRVRYDQVFWSKKTVIRVAINSDEQLGG